MNIPFPNGFKVQALDDKSNVIAEIERHNNSETKNTISMPFKLKQINIAQRVLDYKSAYGYCECAANEHGFRFIPIMEPEVKNIPILTWIKSLL